jgi:hypothetical protein
MEKQQTQITDFTNYKDLLKQIKKDLKLYINLLIDNKLSELNKKENVNNNSTVFIDTLKRKNNLKG